jgi:hypothetical protein
LKLVGIGFSTDSLLFLRRQLKLNRGETEIGQHFVKLGDASLFSKRSVLQQTIKIAVIEPSETYSKKRSVVTESQQIELL